MDESDGKIVRLIAKGKKGLIHGLFSRLGMILLLLVVQAVCLFGMFKWFESILPHIYGGTIIFMVIMVLYMLNSRLDPTAKLTWLIVILPFPVFGGLLFWFTRSELGHRMVKKKVEDLILYTKKIIPQSSEARERCAKEAPEALVLSNYMSRSGCYPVYENTDVTYFPLGEDMFPELLAQLEQAKSFIFLEYFIIDEGIMWGKVLEILERKAAEGVEVRVTYDGTCEFALLPRNYPKRLKSIGIQCKVFAPATPFISTHYNYRDHRKIAVIDGRVAFNGGVNLADEYINKVQKYGHWKDTSVMVKGEAVKSYTLMFLQMWNIDENKPEFNRYLEPTQKLGEKREGFVIPYGDCPLDEDRVGERVYMDILNRAKHYVHIMSPYLILDSEMETALKFAAERGVEVGLILPGIPDKKIPYALAKTHYASLLDSGVHIYEYTPGFVHAKVMVSDHREAVVGTINLDYRSLYHHFECATYMYDTSCIGDIEADYNHTRKRSRVVTKETIKNEKLGVKAVGTVAKVIAPLL